ncbi:MAG TPA: cysteine hydrolase [Anaerolineae bacterium]|nr:cysteine hydrolase [Anaerolineae bacterium]HIQ11498.1 cysteine hydrolase [Caldilineales bacterium]
MTTVVMVIDMERGFTDPEGALYAGDTVREIIGPIREILQAEGEKGSHFIFTRDWHDPDDQEFQMWPPHCIQGTWETEIDPALAEFTENSVIINKRRYSAFFDTNLDELLRRINPDQVIVTGVATDICVMYTTADLRNRDYPVVIPANAVTSFDPEAHAFALKHMAKILGVKVVPDYETWLRSQAKEPIHA